MRCKSDTKLTNAFNFGIKLSLHLPDLSTETTAVSSAVQLLSIQCCSTYAEVHAVAFKKAGW